MKKIITLTITFLLFVLVPVMQGWSQDRYIRCVPNTVSGILPAMTDSSGKIIMNFDSLPDFSLTFSPWQAVDKDGKATYGIQDHTFPHSGEAMAFIVFNPSQVNPSMSGDTAIQPHTGSKFAGCFSAQEPPNNDWLISPRVSLKYNGTFSFWVKSYTSQYGLEKFNVAVSVTDSTPSSFTVISGSNPLEAPTKWTKF
ncbi:MAG: choice-of-anchor J domain-containing protein, partial [Bacteroidota bacterium]|nr:choice-of-anchor J domain-containing protein [Bacteroidota bacterium]